MKTTNRIIIVLAFMLFAIAPYSSAQDDSSAMPQYITVTTMHWNMDNEDFNMKEWIATEKEFMDKVTKKNEHIVGASFYTHRYTPDNRELIYVQVYSDWAAIDKANDRNAELSKEAWPDEKARNAFFEKQASYYGDFHSDEIYATMSGAKNPTEALGDDMILYVRKSHFAYPDDGSGKEFNDLRMEFTNNVIHKNELIKGYWPNGHAWGADRTEFVEAFLVNSMADLDNMFEKQGELVQAHWADEEKRKEMNKNLGKYFTGVHGDYIYSMVGELVK
jgi:hypothetical protein